MLAMTPALAMAQEPVSKPVKEINTATRAVLLANCPIKFTEAEWLKMMEKPVHRSLYPLRISLGMLDTLNARELDSRYQYIMDQRTYAAPNKVD
ncbi:MAG: hypothetical protein IPP33_19375 [Flavobacteriales bacterium]|nr:hypothetical protein [Flavobacteriales bacterium]